jgi:hypothetical protein
MTDIFKDILPSILQTKVDVLENETDYNSFLINRALSYNHDCLFYCNEMNMLPQLDKRLQYDYYINSIRAKKRSHSKWHKPMKENDLESVKLYFGYSDAKAKEALKVLTEEQIEMVKKKTTIGE